MKKAIVIYGPPGAGKGTQAELLSRNFLMMHFESGRYLENLFQSSEAKKSKVLKREKKLFDTGKLCTPSWVLRIFSRVVRMTGGAGSGIVFSGPPRTLFEAVGSTRQKGLFDVLEEVYGKKNIYVVQLEVSMKVSGKRNEARYVCSVCGLSRLSWVRGSRCGFCDGALKKRTLDDPEVVKRRMEEYVNRTEPIIREVKKRKYKYVRIDATKRPYAVFQDLVRRLQLKK